MFLIFYHSHASFRFKIKFFLIFFLFLASFFSCASSSAELPPSPSFSSSGSLSSFNLASTSFIGSSSSPLSLFHTGSSTSFASSDHLNLLSSTVFNGFVAQNVAVDSSGDIYITGYTSSSNFPTKNAFQTSFSGGLGPDAFVLKLSSTGQIIFSTYLGGNNIDRATGIAVDSLGNCYIIGYTYSANFPTKDAFNSTNSGAADIFIAKFSATGNLLFSTFFGGYGADFGQAIAVDKSGNIYITGSTDSLNFPTKNPFNSTFGGFDDVFVSKFDSSGHLLFSTYLGGHSWDEGSSIAVDSLGNCYVTGQTSSTNIPTKNPFQSYVNGEGAFIAKFNSSGSLLFSTYFGGAGDDMGASIAVDNSSNCYITGLTSSTNLPTMNAFQSSLQGIHEPFIAKFDASGHLLFSTYFGGGPYGRGLGIAVDSSGDLYLTGQTNALNFPIKDAFNSTYSGNYDAFLAKLNSTGSLLFSSYFGGSGTDVGTGIAVDSARNIYLIGSTSSTDFPTKNVFNEIFTAKGNAFIAKFSTLTPLSNYSTPILSSLVSFVQNNILFTSGIVGIFALVGISIFIEYRKYVKSKTHSSNKSGFTFKTHMKNIFLRHKTRLKKSNRVSDKTFELLDEIEKENSGDK